MPAPPARILSANVPCGFSSTSISPARNIFSKTLFSPTYVAIIFLTCRLWSRNVMPKSLVPALLLITVRFFAPCWRRAAIRFSGIPHRPKPETMMEAPSGMSRTASAASLTTLFKEKSLRSPRKRPRGDDSRREKEASWRARPDPESAGCRPLIPRAIRRSPVPRALPATRARLRRRPCPTRRRPRARSRPRTSTRPASRRDGRTPTTKGEGRTEDCELASPSQRPRDGRDRAGGLAAVLGEDVPPQRARAGRKARHAREARPGHGQTAARHRVRPRRIEQRPRAELRGVAQARHRAVVLG